MTEKSFKRAQGSLEYLLMISGVVLVGVVVFLLVNDVAQQQGTLLGNNLVTSDKVLDAAYENTQIPLTEITTFVVKGGDGEVTIEYVAPGAGNFILVEERDHSNVVYSLNDPIDFESVTDANVFGLPFYENVVVSSGVTNCVDYFYRLRACSADLDTCVVSVVETATPKPTSGCIP